MRVNSKTLSWTGADFTADNTTEWYKLTHMKGYSVSVVATGTGAGTCVLQGSDDFGSGESAADESIGVSNPVDITGSSFAVSNTTGSPFMINAPNTFYKWVRVKFTFTSGTGTLVVRIQAKGET